MTPAMGRMLTVVMAVTAASAVSAQSFEFRTSVKGLSASPAVPIVYDSCLSVLEAGKSTGDGVYQITPQGGLPIEVYCDMSSVGGGWTLVAAQFEADPLPNWGEGPQADYDPTLASKRSFTLLESQLPAHSVVGFGKQLDPVFIDYVPLQYTVADIPKSQVTGGKTGRTYHVARRSDGYYSSHDPERVFSGGHSSDYLWSNTFTLDALGVLGSNWAFAPNANSTGNPMYPGYAMEGQNLNASSDAYAWTVWVR